MQVLMFCRMRRWRKEFLALVDMRFRVFDALCRWFGACLVSATFGACIACHTNDLEVAFNLDTKDNCHSSEGAPIFAEEWADWAEGWEV